MSTVAVLQALLSAIESRPAPNPRRQVPSYVANDPTVTPSAPVPAPLDSAAAAPTSEQLSVQPPANLPLPDPVPATAPTEESLRAQLNQVDLYDLSGEKAAADALQRDDAFKQQQIDEKAQQTKEFFAQQDRQQQEHLQDVQQQATHQLEEQHQKEFWDQKQQQEMQAGMEKELQGLHAAAKQAHDGWRSDFSKGVCHDDAAAPFNADIDHRAGAYKERLDDLGTNATSASAEAAKYKVKLQDEAAPLIDAKTAELHKEHFPEYQGVEGPKGASDNPNKGFGPFDAAGPKDFWPGGEAPRGSFWPGEVGAPPQKGPFFKDANTPPAGGKDIPDGWMKPIDPPIGQQAADTFKRFLADESGSMSIETATLGLSKQLEGAQKPAAESGLSAQDANLVQMFAERQKDLGQPADTVQKYAADLKAMEPPAPPTPPAPSIAVEPAPTAPAAAAPTAPAPAPVAPAPLPPAQPAMAPSMSL